jgi:hypothetical protein
MSKKKCLLRTGGSGILSDYSVHECRNPKCDVCSLRVSRSDLGPFSSIRVRLGGQDLHQPWRTEVLIGCVHMLQTTSNPGLYRPEFGTFDIGRVLHLGEHIVWSPPSGRVQADEFFYLYRDDSCAESRRTVVEIARQVGKRLVDVDEPDVISVASMKTLKLKALARDWLIEDGVVCSIMRDIYDQFTLRTVMEC